jgi:hypothetical protein
MTAGKIRTSPHAQGVACGCFVAEKLVDFGDGARVYPFDGEK